MTAPSGGRRELVVMTTGSGPRAGADGPRGLDPRGGGRLAEIAADPAITVRALFPAEEGRGAAEGLSGPDADETAARMARCYHVDAPDERLDDLAAELRALDGVEAAYVKPPAEPATVLDRATTSERPAGHDVNTMTPSGPDAPPVTPDFVSRQGYLDAAPGGIDARYAWTVAGGRGAGVRIVDCEWGWRFTHEDLLANQGGIVAGTGSTDTDHGTAVLGEISGDVNAIGVTGISPDATVSASAFSVATATAIRSAADRLGPGDVLLLEIHRGGPNATGVGQVGFVAVEWWPDDYLAIRYAVERGIVVVEAAGNGAENLDAPVYDTGAGFPSWWRNPFRRAPLDSGAVLVGAGAPPPNTHGRDWGPDRSRLDFSNWGACLDAQGWGREVTTTGYGDLQGGTNQDLWYTDQFSGTSSASPIVVGALACVQGALQSAGRPRLSPARARELLRSTGSAQQDAPGRPASQRIGNRPNLRQLIPTALATASWVGVQFTGQVPAGTTRRWFTYGWPAHRHVLWTVTPTTVRPGSPSVRWRTRVERSDDARATYWIDITNTTTTPIDVEARFAVLGW